MKQPVIYGHRGASARAPENTMKAFRLAFEEGAMGIEFDVRLSADNEIVVIHDATVDRTSNGTGSVKDLAVVEMRELDFGDGEKVPLLREVLEEFGNNYWLNIEIKEQGLEQSLIELLTELQITDKVVISSFLMPVLLKIKELEKNLSIGFLYDFALTEFDDLLEELPVDGIHPSKENVSANIVKEAHKRALAVRVWTVDDPTKAVALAKMNVDAIITNDPIGILRALEPKSS